MDRCFCIVLFATLLSFCVSGKAKDNHGAGASSTEAKQTWSYVNVRPDAYMFWWLYYTQASEGFTNKPLVLWLQGGPGASSTGYGNFMEIGPLDLNGNQRTTTWLSRASLLFVDNPVGTGYSYVTNDNAYAKDSDMIAKDLVTLLKAFLDKIGDFKKVPFYIFSESYGGKMTAALAKELYTAIKKGKIECNFQGFAMGDSWISPMDSVLTWGPYLYATSLVDEAGLSSVNVGAQRCVTEAAEGNWAGSTEAWNQLETIVEASAAGVNFYNILKWDGTDTSLRWRSSKDGGHKLAKLFEKHVRVHQTADLNTFMNGPIRNKLAIIPKNVTWGGQAGAVFAALSEDFMKNVTDIVDFMLTTDIKVVVYSGQLDLIVDTLGTEQWVQRLSWPSLRDYNRAVRKPFAAGSPPTTAGFSKHYRNFSFYWILNAGHMVPMDAGEAALVMLDSITKS